MSKKLPSIILGITLLALSPFFVYGQLLDPVDYKIVESPDSVKAGDLFTVTVKAIIEDGWHLYSVNNDPDAGPFPTSFSIKSDGALIAGKVIENEAEIAFDPNFNTELGWHSRDAIFEIPIAFHPSQQGDRNLVLEVLYQACDDISCLPPKTKQVNSNIKISGVSNTVAVEFSDFDNEKKKVLETNEADFKYGSIGFVLGVILIGLICFVVIKKRI